MKTFPKLKLPLDRRTINPDEGRQLLAYDIIQRLASEVVDARFNGVKLLSAVQLETLITDAEANLHSLGNYITAEIGADRFDEPPVDDGTVYETLLSEHTARKFSNEPDFRNAAKRYAASLAEIEKSKLTERERKFKDEVYSIRIQAYADGCDHGFSLGRLKK